MTVVISYVSDLISVIATDNRVSKGVGVEYGFEDGITKLISIPHYAMGWTAGSGYGSFLDSFKAELVKSEMSMDEIVKKYEEVKNQAIVESLLLHKDDVDNSVVIFSWCGKSGEGYLSPSIGMLSEGRLGGGITLIEPNYFRIVYPADFSKEMVANFEKNNNLNYKLKEDEGIEHLIEAIASIAYKISNSTNLVSKTLDLGFQCITEEGIVNMKSFIDLDKLVGSGNVNVNFEVINIQPINWG